ncbi:MAG: GTPase/DUF3482 domain-containing protein [Gammaproteobacteria bacterium]
MTAQFTLAVVGHTNVGKTSLLRTLVRSTTFGVVSNRPATTRHAEAVRIDLGDAEGFELVDTPGFEDPSGLLDLVHTIRADPRELGRDTLQRFLAAPAADAEYAQEAKAIRQMLRADLLILVVDAREPALGKFLDEFRLLGLLGKPTLVMLNFVARPNAAPARWRDAALASGLHNVTEFDTVVFDADDEQRLWQQVELLLPGAASLCARILARNVAMRREQRELAARLVAQMLVDCTALRVRVDGESSDGPAPQVRAAENRLHADLLGSYRFDERDYAASDLPLPTSQWTWDPFAPDVLEELGLSLGLSAAKGAAVGATVDAFTAFHSLGAATLIGAGIGAGLDALSRLGGVLREKLDGARYLQIEPGVAVLLARRAVAFIADLERRGHAAQGAVSARARVAEALRDEATLRELLARCRRHPEWSRFDPSPALEDRARDDVIARLVTYLKGLL